MRETVKEFETRGLRVLIYPDDDAQSPDEWHDEGLFLVGFHRQFWVRREGFDEGLVGRLICPRSRQDRPRTDDVAEIRRKYHAFALEAYIHSGVALALAEEGGFPDRQWDVSNPVGAVFVAKGEMRARRSAKKAARSLISEWNQYLAGDIYGYVVEDGEGNHLDSCWGHYGLDHAVSEGRAAAEYLAEGMAMRRPAAVPAMA